MNLKEKLDIAFKFTALAVFALLVSCALNHRPHGEFHFRGDMSKKIAMGKMPLCCFLSPRH